jgi:hypothetical protein
MTIAVTICQLQYYQLFLDGGDEHESNERDQRVMVDETWQIDLYHRLKRQTEAYHVTFEGGQRLHCHFCKTLFVYERTEHDL